MLMPTDACAATALPSPGALHFARSPIDPPALAERDRFVLDLFRLLRLFRESYDEAWLARAEALAERRLGQQADALMGAAVLLDNELRCRGVEAYAVGRPGDARPQGSEPIFLAFLDAAAGRAAAVAVRTAAALGVDDHRVLVSAAQRFAELACSASTETASATALQRLAGTAKLTSRNVFE
jgi:hypothetical protein